MSDVPRLSEATFKSEVIESTLPVLVDFTAAWCGPCKMIEPLLKQLAQDWDGKIKVSKLDVDENPNISLEYQVMGIPTLILFKNGQPVERVTGYLPMDRLQKKFSPHL